MIISKQHRLGIGVAILLGVALAGPAAAVTCARGDYHAGCAGPNGAVAVRKPAGYFAHPAPYAHTTVVAAPHATVVAPAPVCRWVNGVRVCR